MPNIFMKLHFQHPDQEFGWTEKYYLLGQTDLPGAKAVADKILAARLQMCAVDVLLRYAYVSDEAVFRDRLYLFNPGYTIIAAKAGGGAGGTGTDKQYIYNADLLKDGPAAEPEVAMLFRVYNREGTHHGRVFMRGMAGSYFQTDPDAYVKTSATWSTAYQAFKDAIGARGDNAGAKVGFKVLDKTAPKNPITACTYAGGLLTVTFTDPPGAAAAGLAAVPAEGIRIGRAEGTGLRINKTWKALDVTWVNNYKVTLTMPNPGFTWRKGGYVQGISHVIAPAANLFFILEYYTEHKTGVGRTPHKGRQRKRTADITF